METLNHRAHSSSFLAGPSCQRGELTAAADRRGLGLQEGQTSPWSLADPLC